MRVSELGSEERGVREGRDEEGGTRTASPDANTTVSGEAGFTPEEEL